MRLPDGRTHGALKAARASPRERRSYAHAMSTGSISLPERPGPSKITGRPSKRGSERNAIMPSTPISPSPRLTWRSRFEPSSVIESLTCSACRRSQPTTRSNSSITFAERLARAHVVARGEQVAGVQADAEPLLAARQLEQRRELLERAAQRPARARGVLQQQRARLGLRERLLDHLAARA